MKCLVKGCGRVLRKGDASVTFHRVPTKEPLRSHWLEALGMSSDTRLPGVERVCSDHFSAESYLSWDVSKKMGFELKRKRLSDDSVPSLHMGAAPTAVGKRRRTDDPETPATCKEDMRTDHGPEHTIVLSGQDLAVSPIEIVPVEEDVPDSLRCSELQHTASSDHGNSISLASADHTYSIEKKLKNKGEHCLHPAFYTSERLHERVKRNPNRPVATSTCATRRKFCSNHHRANTCAAMCKSCATCYGATTCAAIDYQEGKQGKFL
ncbi:uncharacterized protein LOC121834620 [Ixodes scapularis]|uniref:uncharacterized protein LOC121834620 n=1 Tax=Ixodes scapularis TaxID=6945 RepID=UPI001C380176|nr:uncharacterized protein LOC121834620 [Ixodes scapularis]